MNCEKIKIFIEKLLRFFYPNTCPLCGRVIREEVCPDCARRVQPIRESLCKTCGKPIRSSQAEYCLDCSHTVHDFDCGRALYVHRGQAAWSIYQFKFHNRRIYGRFYAGQLADRYGTLVQKWGVTRILPIPLSRKKRRLRGFNQAQILALELAERLGIPADTGSLVRIRHTKPQRTLDPVLRRQNVRRAFGWTGGSLAGERVLLVDDIYTTGSTLDGAARLLKRAGAEKVYFLTVSIGQGY